MSALDEARTAEITAAVATRLANHLSGQTQYIARWRERPSQSPSLRMFDLTYRAAEPVEFLIAVSSVSVMFSAPVFASISAAFVPQLLNLFDALNGPPSILPEPPSLATRLSGARVAVDDRDPPRPAGGDAWWQAVSVTRRFYVNPNDLFSLEIELGGFAADVVLVRRRLRELGHDVR